MPRGAKPGVTHPASNIRYLRDLGIFLPCQSAWNTPLLLVKKPNSTDYRPVQDLQEVNKRLRISILLFPNLCTLLSTLPTGQVCYTILDLMDPFSSLPLPANSQAFFVFEGLDPDGGYNRHDCPKLSETPLASSVRPSMRIWMSLNPNVSLMQYY